MAVPVVLEIQLTVQQREALEELREMGLFGSTVDEVAEWAVAEWLRDAWRDKLISPPRVIKA